VMYDRVAAAQPAAATVPATPRPIVAGATQPAQAAPVPDDLLAQLSGVVLANAGLTAIEKAALLLELARQAPQPPAGLSGSGPRVLEPTDSS
jgi:hypothetical protein